MKLIASGVTKSAAMTRSPSFSRSSSSTRITIRPAFSSAMISGVEASVIAVVVRCEKGRILRHGRCQRGGFAGFGLALAIRPGVDGLTAADRVLAGREANLREMRGRHSSHPLDVAPIPDSHTYPRPSGARFHRHWFA